MDENLNWKYHINEACLNVSKLAGILYRMRPNLTSESMLSIYYTLIYPHFTYCVSMWASTWPSFTTKINTEKRKENKIKSVWMHFFMTEFDSAAI